MKKVVQTGKYLLAIGIILIFSAILLSACGGSPSGATPEIKPSVSTTQAVQPTKVTGGASVSAVPSVKTISPGSSFDVSIQVQTEVPSRGFECILNWDPQKVQCSGVEPGDFYKSYIQANKLKQFISPDPLDFNNEIGKFPAAVDVVGTINHKAGIAVMGGEKNADGSYPGPKGSGSVYILHMTAKSDASGTVEFKLSQVKINNNTSPPLAIDAKIENGSINISGSK